MITPGEDGLIDSVRITKMLMGGAVFASEASEKKFPAPAGGGGKS